MIENEIANRGIISAISLSMSKFTSNGSNSKPRRGGSSFKFEGKVEEFLGEMTWSGIGDEKMREKRLGRSVRSKKVGDEKTRGKKGEDQGRGVIRIELASGDQRHSGNRVKVELANYHASTVNVAGGNLGVGKEERKQKIPRIRDELDEGWRNGERV